MIPSKRVIVGYCRQCFNAEAAKLGGVDFGRLNFEPVCLVDCLGQAHEFHFRTHLFGPGVALDAFELRDGSPAGYQFQIIGDPEEELLALLGRLIDKMRRALSVKHIQDSEYGLQVAHKVVRDRIEWDEAEDGRVPLIVVNGREITWDQFGRMDELWGLAIQAGNSGQKRRVATPGMSRPVLTGSRSGVSLLS